MARLGWRKGPVAVLVVVGLVAASCGGGDSADEPGTDSPAPETSEPTGDAAPTGAPVPAGDATALETVIHKPDIAEPETVWDEFLAEMDDDGRVSKESALEAFALAYGPIPGVEVRAGDPGAVASMTARSWLSHHRDDLALEQTEAIHAALQTVDADGRPMEEWPDPSGDGADDEEALGANGVGLIAFAQDAPIPGPKSCWNWQPVALTNAPGSEPYRPLIDQELAELASKLGPLGIPVYLGFAPGDGTALADANPWNADCDRRASSCTVRLMPEAVAYFTADLAALRNVVLHELVHCYQGARAPVNNVLESLPWIVEGFANFAEQDVHPETAWTFEGSWAEWFSKAATPLTERAYDAMGFFGHIVAVGGDPWASIETALATTQSIDQFTAFTGDVSQEFADTWASSLSRQSDRGAAWDDELPAIPPTVPEIITVTIFDGIENVFKTAPFGAILFEVVFDADLVVVNPTAGHGRLGWRSGDEILLDPLGADMAYCTVAGGCECPSGQTSSALSDAAVEIARIPSDSALLALASDPSAGEIAITGMSISETCSDTPPPSDDNPGGGAALWEGNVCGLLADVDVAAVFGGRPPTSTEPFDANTVAADGYGGASCRWKVSTADHLFLDVFPSADVNMEELAAYDPNDRWFTEGLAGIGDEAWVQRWNADSALPVEPGVVGSIVVVQGGVGLRLAITAGWPPQPDGLVAAARVILEGDS